MRKRRRHLAHRGQARNVNEFGLKFLQPGFGFLPFGEIADKAREEALVRRPHFTDSQLHRKRRAIFAFSDNDASDPDDPAFAGPRIAFEIAIMAFTVGEGMSILMFLPTTSFGPYPNNRSAATLNDCIIPRSLITIIASGTVSRIDLT